MIVWVNQDGEWKVARSPDLANEGKPSWKSTATVFGPSGWYSAARGRWYALERRFLDLTDRFRGRAETGGPTSMAAIDPAGRRAESTHHAPAK